METENRIDYLRQLDILSPERMKGLSITLIGCGGIGSMTGLILAKMGIPNIWVYDFDNIEAHNIPNQFLPSSIGMAKVEGFKSLMNIIIDGQTNIYCYNRKVNEKIARNFKGIIITAVDTMTVRKEVFNTLKNRPSVQLLIDGRMGGETGRVYTICPYKDEDIELYEKSLYSDADAPTDGNCTARAIIYNTAFIGSLIAAQLKKFITQQPYPKELLFNLRDYQIFFPHGGDTL